MQHELRGVPLARWRKLPANFATDVKSRLTEANTALYTKKFSYLAKRQILLDKSFNPVGSLVSSHRDNMSVATTNDVDHWHPL